MLSVIDEHSVSDVVTFAVRNPSTTLLHHNLSYYTESVAIFSSNPVFAKLIRKCKAKQKKHLKLPNMTVAAFIFIRDGFHGRYSGLDPHNVVDIFSASKYYQLAHIHHQCTQFLSNINDLDDYFTVHKAFANYPKELFESFLSGIGSQSHFIQNYTANILDDQRLITTSCIFQMKSLCSLVLTRGLISHQKCYGVIRKWCRFHFESSIQPLLSILSRSETPRPPSGERSDCSGSMDTVLSF